MRDSQTAVDVKRGHLLDAIRRRVKDGWVLLNPECSDVVGTTGIKRGDEQIRLDIIDELRLEPSIDADSIDVDVENGIVSLTGCVDSNGGEWLIESAARRIAGVGSVAVHLKIVLPEPGICTDDDIRRDCEHALATTVMGENHAIKVRVNSGWVTLSGNVACGYERWTAEEIVSSLIGVNGVNGQITVNSWMTKKASSPIERAD
ncbi:BON domain-containing protein [Noviherbaspirillum sp.]|uniref:BON domain-containing protein n=1 Tax=Noviherbaspirillum sp. TaxID=1926288 RepID=UPI002FE313DF